MSEQYRQKILNRCIAAWKSELPAMRMKRELGQEVTNDYSLRLKVKALQAFKINRKYR